MFHLKRTAASVLATLSILAILVPAYALAAPNDVYVNARNSSDTADQTYILPIPAASSSGVLGVRGDFGEPTIMGLGTTICFSPSTNQLVFCDTVDSLFQWVIGEVTFFESEKASTTFVNNLASQVTTNTIDIANLALNQGVSSSSLAIVAFSGSYNDLSNKPSSTGQIQSDWNQASTTALDFIKNKPSIPAAQVQSNWTQTSTTASSYIQNKPTLGISYEGTTQRTNSFPIFKSATVASGVAVFNLTADGTAGGTALFPNGVEADSVNAFVSDATASYQMSYAFSNSNKTLTVTANKLTTSNILTGILGQAQANGSVVKLQVWGY